VTALGVVAKVLPAPARSLAIRWREQWRLNRLPAATCEAAALAALDTERLAGLLGDPALDAEWPAVARELERFEITSAAGGVNPGDRRALYYLVRGLGPRRVLEVGTHIGASTVHIAAALRANGGRPEERPSLITVDILDVNDPVTRPWERYGSHFSPAAMIEKLGMADAVRFIARPSLEFLSETTEPFDLIFLDGDHGAATVYRELPAALRRLRPGGIVLLHDYFPRGRALWPGESVIAGPWLGVERLRREGAALSVLPLGKLRWPTKLGSTVTSLAVVARQEPAVPQTSS